jgi:hypothetical protein
MSLYRFTCTYCGKKWDMQYKYKAISCSACNDKNIKCEEISKKDYYEKENTQENNLHDDWRD